MRMEKGLHVARWVPRGWGLGLTKKMKPREGKAWGRDGEPGPAPTWYTENSSQLHPSCTPTLLPGDKYSAARLLIPKSGHPFSLDPVQSQQE